MNGNEPAARERIVRDRNGLEVDVVLTKARTLGRTATVRRKVTLTG